MGKQGDVLTAQKQAVKPELAAISDEIGGLAGALDGIVWAASDCGPDSEQARVQRLFQHIRDRLNEIADRLEDIRL